VMNRATLDSILARLWTRRKEAEATLSDPGMVSAIETLRGKALAQMAESAPEAKELRENAYFFLRALRGVEEELVRRIAEHDTEKKRQDRLKDPNRPNRTIID